MRTCIGIFLCLLIAGCGSTYYTPRAVFKYVPKSDQVRWLNGSQYYVKTYDSIEVAIAHQGGNTFAIEVTNYSMHPVLISPEQFFYIYNTPSDSAYKQINSPHYAVDPEPQIVSTEKSYAAELQNAPSSASFEGFVDGTLGIIDIFNKGRTEEQKKQFAKEAEERACKRKAEYEKAMYEHQCRLHDIEQDRNYWSGMLRKTTLFSNQQIKGNVQLPMSEPAWLIIAVPINGVNVPFEFKATVL